ncbi:MAG: DUF5671 domain-containing protein [Pseudomonadales bacterium]|nr:DUF5671 domain-containing protein [Pseudomonadales bacterium]
MVDRNLATFIDHAIRAGSNKEQVEQALTAAGWPKEQIADGLRSIADLDFVVPVPTPKPQLLARDAFLYLILFATLYVSGFHFGALLFQFIDLAFVDRLGQEESATLGLMRMSTAALIVAYPIFISVSYYTNRGLLLDPIRRTSPVRRWLTYLTMFIAACVITGDFITVVYSLLSGGLSIPFLLKTFVVGLISSAIFGYYLWAIREDDKALAL